MRPCSRCRKPTPRERKDKYCRDCRRAYQRAYREKQRYDAHSTANLDSADWLGRASPPCRQHNYTSSDYPNGLTLNKCTSCGYEVVTG